jgi:hypothetical protein
MYAYQKEINMSHSTVAVLIPPDEFLGGVNEVEIDAILKERMAYYYEYMLVPEYEIECYCIGQAALDRALACAEKQHGPLDNTRAEFHSLPEDQRTDERWERMTRDRIATQKCAFETDPERNDPNPSCEECSGGGKRKTTRNPHAKWDWYEVGGRWDGVIQDGTDTPAPEGDCFPKPQDGKYPFETPEGLHRNVKIVSSVLVQHPEWYPFAVLTPDKGWFERGEMGWWGIVSNEKPKDEWAKQSREIMSHYPDHILILVDVHI